MKTTVTLTHKQGMRCETILRKAKTVLKIDSLRHQALDDSGPTPMDLLALAHGGCTGMLVAMKASTDGLQVMDGMDIEVTHEYEEGPPMRLKSARIRFVLTNSVTPEQEIKLKAAAGMCPVHTALRPDVPVTMEFVGKDR